jgi:ABC-type polysaccharide/polyol phosphate export permease
MSLPSLRHSLRIQLRVIGALLLRESLTRFGRHNLGFLWLFLEPMIFTLGVAAFWSLLRDTHGSALPIVAFALTGYSSVLLWRNMPARCLSAIEPNLSLMYHRNVRIADIFAARILLEAVGVTASFYLLTVILAVTGWLAPPPNLLKVAAGWLLLGWFGAALAVALSCLGERSEIVEKFWHPCSYLIFPMSGAAFMVEWLPPQARSVVLLIPMVHGVELLRDGFFGGSVRAHYNVGYLVGCCVATTLIALALERDASRRVLPE